MVLSLTEQKTPCVSGGVSTVNEMHWIYTVNGQGSQVCYTVTGRTSRSKST